MSISKNVITAAAIACSTFAVFTANASEDVAVKSLLAKPLPELPGKEVLMLTVTFAPGAADPVHRHDAHGFIYVLEGSIVMQLKGGKEMTVNPGETFYEGPNDVHVVGRNASTTQPARFLVLLVKKQGAPILTVE